MEPTRTELIETMASLWARTRKAMRPPHTQKWTDTELTMRQARALMLLSHAPKRMSDIAARMGKGTSAASTLIDRLVNKGLVQRVEDVSDRRVVTCRLTADGDEAVERFLRLGCMRTERIASVMSEDELKTVVHALEIMADAADRASEEEPEQGSAEAEPTGSVAG